MKYKCVISDLDWTLLTGDSELDEKTQSALITLANNNVLFVPATGRAFSSVPDVILNLPGVKYVITSNGAALYDVSKQTPILSTHLSKEDVEKILQIGEKNNFTLEAFMNGIPYTCKEYYEDPVKFGARPESVAYIQRTRTVVDDVYSFIQNHSEELDCIDIITFSDTKYEMIDKLKKLLPDNYITTSAPQLIEISAGNSGKHNRMIDLIKKLNIDLSEVVAFGDGDNDSDMLKLAGFGVAVGNATSKCKENANLVTDTNENLGVYKALCQLFPELL